MNQEELERKKAEMYLNTRGWIDLAVANLVNASEYTWTNPSFHGRFSLQEAVKKQVTSDVASIVYVLENLEGGSLDEVRKLIMSTLVLGLIDVIQDMVKDAFKDPELHAKIYKELETNEDAKVAINALRVGIKNWLAEG